MKAKAAVKELPKTFTMGSVEECKQFSDLHSYYKRKTEEIATTTALLAKYSDISSVSDEDKTVLNQICTDMGKIQKLLAAISNDQNKLSHTLECNKVTLARLDILREQLQEQQENIPQFMPTPVSNKKEEVDVEPPHTPVDIKPQHCVRFEEEKKPVRTRPVASTGSRIPSKTKKQKTTRTTHVPSIEFLTMEEFKTLPKYMVGRIKYEQINSLIEELNNVTVSKYKIMDTPVNKLNSDNMRRYTRMTEVPETKDTIGMIWFDIEDVKDFTSTPTIAHSFGKMVPLLRHCHRLRQVRAGKVERYVVLM